MSTAFDSAAEIDSFGDMPTDERLRLLASILRAEVESGRWDQQFFAGSTSGRVIEATQDWEDLAGRGRSVVACNTTLCTAGWAVTIMPRSEISDGDDWVSAACRGLGISDDLGEMLFYWIPSTKEERVRVNSAIPEFLDMLATLAPEDRTPAGALAALTDPLRDLLLPEWIEELAEDVS